MTASDDHNHPEIHPEAAVAPGYLIDHPAKAFHRLVDAALRPHGMSLALIGPVMLLSWKGPMLQRPRARLRDQAASRLVVDD